ncbi:hypothetical protein BC939DRAFT_470685 [Gamsiella multidivaricata]|uniref:uncharacterized protein n=1 Tax=Gamsiella multidivaricata TaxID=101098 RepID=UPI00221E9A08|nr:uncharacterized protein BC939DRAFT_470685 [Gamsiella multidivaricata]KAI7816028.1 hypothetical protein BC939DRAFT_470685 [Gamsiella multidivaricata]
MEVSAPFLPQSIATMISTVSLGARVSLRTAAIIVEALLETLQHGTSATLGISRRSLLAAVSTAKILNVLKGSAGPNDAFTMLLDKYTSLGVYVIHHSFTLAELFTISGLQLVSNTLTAGIRTAEESVRVVDGLFGSTETSKALAAVVGLVKKEVYEDQEFAITQAGKMAVLASITKAITVFACLQAATHKRTQKTIRAMLVYEGVVLAKPKKITDIEPTQLATIGSTHQGDGEDEDDSGELLKNLSNALVTDPDDVTQDMTTTQIEKVLSADILQVTTTTTLTTTTTQTFVRPGADLSKLGKPLPPIQQHDRDSSSSPLQRQQQHHYPTSIETASSTRGTSSSMAITARSRRGSVSSIASVATTLTQYATTSIVANPHGSVNGSSTRHGSSTPSDTTGPSESLAVEGSRQANNNLRLMFSTVTKKFKKNQTVHVGGETDGTILTRSQEREIRTSEARNSMDWSEDDTDWIEVEKSSETMSSTEMSAMLSYDVPLEKKNGNKLLGPSAFGLKNGISSKKFGRSFFSKMTKQSSTFGKNSTERRSLDGSTGPRLTITEMDESRSGSDNSLPSQNVAATPTTKGVKISDDDDHEDLRPPPPPKEPAEPNPANFPRDHLVRNIQRFMRYASASYGHNFMRILGIGTIGDAVYSPYGDHPNHHAFATHTSTPLDSILLSSFTDPGTKGSFHAPKMHSLVHYINLDHGAQCVVLTCRGTLGLSDVLTDLCAHYDDLVLPTLQSNGKRGEHYAPPKYKVHSGMYASARLLSLETSKVFRTIKKALEDYPDYGLVLCGHSLGGGVAAILSLLWSMKSEEFEAYVEEEEGSSDEDEDKPITAKAHGGQRPRKRIIYPEITTPFVTSPGSALSAGRPIHCYAYGPPCVMSLPLSKYCQGLITTVVHQYDLVPTLSLGLLKDFKNVATTLHEEGQVVEDIVKRLIIGASSNKPNAERQEAASKVESTTYTSSAGPTPPPSPPKKDHLPETPKRSQSMPMYSEYDRWQLQEAEDQDWSWSLIKTMRADMGSDKLYPPSPVYLLESTATTVVGEVSSTLAMMASAATSVASQSSAGTGGGASSVPLGKSFSASAAVSAAGAAAVSAAGAAAASLANGFRPSSPFGRSSIPTTEAGTKQKLALAEVPKTAYKISMRRFDHVEDRFGELQFARSMFTDHNPANYEICVERLCHAVFPPEEHL